MKTSLFGASLMIWLSACSPQQENTSQTSSSIGSGNGMAVMVHLPLVSV